MNTATASIIASIIAAVGGILGAYLNKVHKDNRKDHSFVADKITDLHSDLRGIQNDMNEVKVDVGILKSRHDDVKNQITELRSISNGKL